MLRYKWISKASLKIQKNLRKEVVIVRVKIGDDEVQVQDIIIAVVLTIIVIFIIVQVHQFMTSRSQTDISGTSPSAGGIQLFVPEETKVVRGFLDTLWNVNEAEARNYMAFDNPKQEEEHIRNIRRIMEQVGTEKPSDFTAPVTLQVGRLTQVTVTVIKKVSEQRIFLVRKKDGKAFDLGVRDENDKYCYQYLVPAFALSPEGRVVAREKGGSWGFVQLLEGGDIFKKDLTLKVKPGFITAFVYINGRWKEIALWNAKFLRLPGEEEVPNLTEQDFVKTFGLQSGDKFCFEERITPVIYKKRITCELIKSDQGWKIKAIVFRPLTNEDRNVLESGHFTL